VLALRGYFPVEELYTFDKINSRLQGHPDMTVLPGLEMSTGSLADVGDTQVERAGQCPRVLVLCAPRCTVSSVPSDPFSLPCYATGGVAASRARARAASNTAPSDVQSVIGG
jgi:hypothetical protein